jgi:hypothetical protein
MAFSPSGHVVFLPRFDFIKPTLMHFLGIDVANYSNDAPGPSNKKLGESFSRSPTLMVFLTL